MDKEIDNNSDSIEEEPLSKEALSMQIIEAVNVFTEEYFLKIYSYTKEEKIFLRKNKLKKVNKVDYFDIKTYLFTAINSLVELDKNIKEGLFQKIQGDVQNLYEMYLDLVNKNKITGVVFENAFLPTVKFYQKLLKKLETAQFEKTLYESDFKKYSAIIKELSERHNLTEEEQDNLSIAKRKNADAVYNFAESKEEVSILFEEEKAMKEEMKKVFIPEFEIKRDIILIDLKEIINVKSFYLDKTLWHYAAQSISIKRFFRNANIKGDFSLKIYLIYSLNNVDMEKTQNKEYYQNLERIIKELD